jgi:hypothetical protein
MGWHDEAENIYYIMAIGLTSASFRVHAGFVYTRSIVCAMGTKVVCPDSKQAIPRAQVSLGHYYVKCPFLASKYP